MIDVLVQVIFELGACLDLNLRTFKTDLARDTKRANAVLRNVLLSRELMRCLELLSSCPICGTSPTFKRSVPGSVHQHYYMFSTEGS